MTSQCEIFKLNLNFLAFIDIVLFVFNQYSKIMFKQFS
jgi:hypothetical protein